MKLSEFRQYHNIYISYHNFTHLCYKTISNTMQCAEILYTFCVALLEVVPELYYAAKVSSVDLT